MYRLVEPNPKADVYIIVHEPECHFPSPVKSLSKR